MMFFFCHDFMAFMYEIKALGLASRVEFTLRSAKLGC